MQLSKRKIEIILKLIDLDTSITIKELASIFSVSVRTIKYDLEDIRIWLTSKKIKLYSQRNKGIWLDLSSVQKISLKNELLEVERFEVYEDQVGRINYVLLELLLKENYITIIKLSEILDVSTSTITIDLDTVDKFLNRFNVNLERRSGYGIKLIGEEIQIRLLMEYLLQVELTEYDIYKIMNQLVNPLSEKSLSFLGVDEVNQVVQSVIRILGKILTPTLLEIFNYSDLLALSLKTSISVCRMKSKFSMNSFKILNNNKELKDIEGIAFMLMKKVFDHYDLPLFEDEYYYISGYLTENNNNVDILELTKTLISQVSSEFNFAFEQDNQLLINLFTHLSLRVGKKTLFINEYNPFIDEIRKEQPELFRAIENCCIKEKYIQYNLINESFIAYIMLHFLVSLEKQKREVINVVYVCATGLGVTNLIQQRVQEEILNIDILEFASVLNYEEIIQEKTPDLVISIFPLEEINCPMIKVNAIPSKEDIQHIKSTVQYLLDQEGGHPVFYNTSKAEGTVEDKEVMSQDVIVKGYIIYETLRKKMSKKIKNDYEEAFLLHVLLMVNRIYFNTQYKTEECINHSGIYENKQVIIQIEQLFSEHNLSVNHSELIALLQYLEL